jgi:DNA-binding transcriptional LysR family regulator
MFLRQFQYLVTLDEEKNFGRAAQRCNVSQPSLSSAIKQLEQELGVPIVLRHQRFGGFTEEGRRVLEWGKRILADRDAMLEELALMHRNLEGRIRIGAMPMSSPVLPVIDRLFFMRYPGVQIETHFIGLDRMIDGLTNSRFDVGVTYLDEQPLGRLKTLPLYEEQFGLLIPDKGWADNRASMTWAEAAGMPLCLLSPSTHERQTMDKAFARSGVIPKPRIESESILNLVFHVMQSDLATVIPTHFQHFAGPFQRTRLIQLEKPRVTQKVGLVWVEGNPMRPMTRAMVELMKEAIKTGTLASHLAGNSRLPSQTPATTAAAAAAAGPRK